MCVMVCHGVSVYKKVCLSVSMCLCVCMYVHMMFMGVLMCVHVIVCDRVWGNQV